MYFLLFFFVGFCVVVVVFPPDRGKKGGLCGVALLLLFITFALLFKINVSLTAVKRSLDLFFFFCLFVCLTGLVKSAGFLNFFFFCVCVCVFFFPLFFALSEKCGIYAHFA